MKAQFATLEGVLAMLLAVSAMSAASAMLNASQHSLTLARGNLSSAAAAYDFTDQLTHNASAQQCLLTAFSNASSCIGNYTRYYKQIYGISAIGVIMDGHANNYSRVYCSNYSAGIVCVGVS